jgi:RNA polymerase sigma-32 factor
LDRQDEYMFAKHWREHGDRGAAHRLVTSHLRLVAKIAMGYRGYGLSISEVISEGNVGLMQAVKRFEPEKGFRFATYAMWWIKAAIQEYILRSWSLVKLGTTANQKKLFFNLRKTKSKISALDEGDLRPDQVKIIARQLGVTEQDVVDMNRRLRGDVSLNAPIREEGDSGEWQDRLVDEISDQETRLAESEESDNRRKALGASLSVALEFYAIDVVVRDLIRLRGGIIWPLGHNLDGTGFGSMRHEAPHAQFLLFVGRGWGQQRRSSACAIIACTTSSHGLPKLATS